MLQKQVTIRNEAGFHIRPAQLFSEKAGSFQSAINVKPEGQDAAIDAKSILGLMTLGLSKGSMMIITAEGPDEESAVDTLARLVEEGFGEA
jgi:phosphocarrier protein HPr/phosphocarrier protein